MSGYDPALFARLAEVEDESFWYRARNRLLVDVVRRRFPDARSLLEIGCGTGVVLRGLRASLPHLRLTGVDVFEEALAVARRRLPEDVELRLADATALDYREAFDVAIAPDVLEHVEDDRAVVRGMFAALRGGGGAVVLVPQHPRLWSAADDVAHHVRRYRRGELLDRLRAAGFEVLHASSFVFTLTPAALLSRAVRRGRYDLVAELVPPRPLNALFERVLDAERGLVVRGASLPFGTSLLAIARKP